MPRKPDYSKDDATSKLAPGAATQKTEKGLKIGLPDRKDVFAAFRKISRPAKPKP